MALKTENLKMVGKLGGGWKVTLTGLMAERLAIGGVMPVIGFLPSVGNTWFSSLARTAEL